MDLAVGFWIPCDGPDRKGVRDGMEGSGVPVLGPSRNKPGLQPAYLHTTVPGWYTRGTFMTALPNPLPPNPEIRSLDVDALVPLTSVLLP